MLFNTKIFIQPEDVYQYFLDHKKELEDNMKMVASINIDDFDKKSILFMTNEDNNLLLSLEAPDVIVDSEYCSGNDTKDTVYDFLEKLDKMYPITLYKKYPNSNNYYSSREYICQLTEEIDKYMLGTSDVYKSYLCDCGPRKEHDGKEGYVYAIRSPGSTKGHIYLDKDNVITEVKFYDHALRFFELEIKKLENGLLGYQLTKEQ